MAIDQKKIESAIACCEDAYLCCFCTAEKIGACTRYRDAKLPDMHFHNCTLIPRDAYDSQDALAAICQGELDHRRSEGAAFCKLSLSADPKEILDLLDSPGEIQHFGHYMLPAELSAAGWPRRKDGEIKRTESPDAIESIIVVDEAYTEGTMTKFLQRKNHRRGEAYVADGGIENYIYFLEGEAVGICNLFLSDGAAKIEDFVVSPAMQRQGVGSTLLAHVIAEAQTRGAALLYLLTDEEDTAKDMYEKLGFTKVGDSYALLFFFQK